MLNKELHEQFNIKDLIARSNAKIDKWQKWATDAVDCELIYISIFDYDIYIKGINYQTGVDILNLIKEGNSIHNKHDKEVFYTAFHIKYGVSKSNLIAIGKAETPLEDIHSMIIKKLKLEVTDLTPYIQIEYNKLLNKLYYKDTIIIHFQNKTYKPLKYI